MDYILTLIFVLLESGLLFLHGRYKNDRIFAFAGLFLVIAFCGMRRVVFVQNSDTVEYQRMYGLAQGLPLAGYLEKIAQIEVLFFGFFWICSRFSLPYTAVRVLYFALMYFFAVKVTETYRCRGNRYFDYFFLATNLVLGCCLMRISFAYAMCWLAVLLYFEGDRKKAYALAIAAFFVHFSALIIIGFFIFLAVMEKPKKLYQALLLYSLPVVVLVLFLPAVLSRMGEISSKIAFYLSTRQSGSIALLSNLVRMLLLFLIFMTAIKIGEYRNHMKLKHVILLLLFSFLIIPIQFYNSIGYRFLDYFNIANYIACGYIRGHCNACGKRVLYAADSVCIGILNLWVLYRFLTVSAAGYGLVPIYW